MLLEGGVARKVGAVRVLRAVDDGVGPARRFDAAAIGRIVRVVISLAIGLARGDRVAGAVSVCSQREVHVGPVAATVAVRGGGNVRIVAQVLLARHVAVMRPVGVGKGALCVARLGVDVIAHRCAELRGVPGRQVGLDVVVCVLDPHVDVVRVTGLVEGRAQHVGAIRLHRCGVDGEVLGMRTDVVSRSLDTALDVGSRAVTGGVCIATDRIKRLVRLVVRHGLVDSVSLGRSVRAVEKHTIVHVDVVLVLGPHVLRVGALHRVVPYPAGVRTLDGLIRGFGELALQGIRRGGDLVDLDHRLTPRGAATVVDCHWVDGPVEVAGIFDAAAVPCATRGRAYDGERLVDVRVDRRVVLADQQLDVSGAILPGACSQLRGAVLELEGVDRVAKVIRVCRRLVDARHLPATGVVAHVHVRALRNRGVAPWVAHIVDLHGATVSVGEVAPHHVAFSVEDALVHAVSRRDGIRCDDVGGVPVARARCLGGVSHVGNCCVRANYWQRLRSDGDGHRGCKHCHAAATASLMGLGRWVSHHILLSVF